MEERRREHTAATFFVVSLTDRVISSSVISWGFFMSSLFFSSLALFVAVINGAVAVVAVRTSVARVPMRRMAISWTRSVARRACSSERV